MSSDIAYALRGLTRAPGFSALAIGVLALGIGATTLIYGVLKAVVLDPLPVAEPHELVVIRESNPPRFPTFSVAPGNYLSWKAEVTAFESMSLAAGSSFNLTGGREPARLRGAYATPEYFTTFGVPAALGRVFTEADTGSEGEPVVLSHATWMTHFGGDVDVIGRAVTINGRSLTVLGVMPASFKVSAAELWTPWRLGANEAQQHGAHYAGAIGRLAPGMTQAQAQEQLASVAARLEQEFPASNTGWTVVTEPLTEALLGDSRQRLSLLFGGVALVLLIACANVASLTLVRATGRAHEFAIRRAQGASAWRLARQLLSEGLVLAMVGGLAGLALAAFALPLVRAFAPPGMPRVDEIAFEPAIAGAALAISLLAGLVAAAVPAWMAARRAVAGDLRDGGRGATGARGSRLRLGLVVAEVALAVVLLAGAGILGRSLASLNAVDPGFVTVDNGYTRLALPGSAYEGDESAARFYAQLSERVAGLPGVRAAGVVQSLPMVSDYVLTFEVDGRPVEEGKQPSANYYAASAGYLDAMGIPLKRGRGLTDADRAGAARVMLVSEAFAERFFPGQEVIGQRIRPGNGDDAWREIVGVVGDVRQYGLDADLQPQMYEPFAQAPFHSAFVVFDAAGGAPAMGSQLRAVVRAIDPDLPMSEVVSVASAIEATLATRRFSTWLLGLFAATALLLAAIGLYGTLAYAVSQSTRELGVRIALGAQTRVVLGMVVGQGLRLVALGAGLGVVVALGGGRLMEGFVYGVSTRDPLTLGVIVLVMLLVALAASALPAWRATRVDPMEALRHE